MEVIYIRKVNHMFKKIGLILLCSMLLTSCGNKAPYVEPRYAGNYWRTFDVVLEDHLVPDDFVDEKMEKDIKKVLKEHKVKDGPIDKETAVDIAIAVSKNLNYDDFFTKPTEYRISPRLDANAYLVSISPVLENPNLLVELNTDNVAISQTDGTVIAYWVS